MTANRMKVKNLDTGHECYVTFPNKFFFKNTAILGIDTNGKPIKYKIDRKNAKVGDSFQLCKQHIRFFFFYPIGVELEPISPEFEVLEVYSTD